MRFKNDISEKRRPSEIDLTTMNEMEIRIFIRGVLMHKGKRLRFDMSGYDRKEIGDCQIHNQKILNKFAFLGLYQIFEFIGISFYQGNCFLTLKGDYPNRYYNLDSQAQTTTDIIGDVLMLTRELLIDYKKK
tara:strand:+ start:238 stop:633 length:396 start_codon:yes stop_codon:yes gene_type:complete